MMMTDTPLTRDLVLIGGGHAHALVLRRWGMDPLPGARLTVVNPGPTAPYTGMLPGHVAGHYAHDELDIDLVRLARFAGARLIDGVVAGFDPVARMLTVPGRAPVPYDVASFDIGITTDMPEIPGFEAHAVPAKPLGAFAVRWRAHLAGVRARDVDPATVVIGGGVAGVELALAMAHALNAAGAPGSVTLIETADTLTGTGPRARDRLLRALAELRVTVRTGERVAAVTDRSVSLASGTTVPAGFVTGVAGARPQAWLGATGLPLEAGFVRVDETLRVVGHEDLFAAGDCAHLTHAPRPKAGVFAVRAAPVLHDNLRAALTGGAMRAYQPQKRYLKLISLGGRSALAERGGLALSGPLVWRWKDRIDTTFMRKLTDLPAMPRPKAPATFALGGDTSTQPMCAGCGSKVAPGALAQALSALPPSRRADVLSRPGDDAAILEIGGIRQVVTTDHLREFTGDTTLFARIAMIHALGDIWAMGARPQAALAQVVLPRMSEALQARTLSEILAAASEILTAEGAELVGGHSTMGAEMTLGFTLTGLCDGTPIGHGGGRPGDVLLLTRPLGTGTILAAEMAGEASGRDVVRMLHVMATPQGDAAAILSGAHAMTDVTGFGLAGHLGAICRASGTGADIDLSTLPFHDGALDLATRGHRSTLFAANRAAAPMETQSPDDPRVLLLHDPQTAGGLLAAVEPAGADALIERLVMAGHAAARIGALTDGAAIRLR